jgi:hypothetical protein
LHIDHARSTPFCHGTGYGTGVRPQTAEKKGYHQRQQEA